MPPRSSRIERVTADGAAPPLDPVGTTVAEFLVDLLDGIVVSLAYSRCEQDESPVPASRPPIVIASRQGPGEWTTTLHVRLAGVTGLVYGSTDPEGGSLPPELSELPEAALRAADAIGRDAGVDGNDLIAPLRRALRDAVVIEMLVGELTRLSGGALDEDGLCDFMTAVLERFEDVASSVVERQALSHGVVVRAAIASRHVGRRYPDDYRQKRVPLLFDGREALLLIDAQGHVEGEIQRTRPERGLPGGFDPDDTHPTGEHGVLVRLTSRRVGGLGFYAHPDRTIWVYSGGGVLLVKRGTAWRALPFSGVVRGISTLAASDTAGELAVTTAFLLSMSGHGGIVAIVQPGADLDACLEDKDRLDKASSQRTEEGAVHAAIDHEELDTATLLRVAAIDGATIIDADGRLVAYGAVVRSDGSNAEGARTAAARSLSRFARVVLKVSEDGPVSVFKDGCEVARLLA